MTASQTQTANEPILSPRTPRTKTVQEKPPLTPPSTSTPSKKKKKSIRKKIKKIFHTKKSSAASSYQDDESSRGIASVKTFGTIEFSDCMEDGDEDLMVEDYEEFYQDFRFDLDGGLSILNDKYEDEDGEDRGHGHADAIINLDGGKSPTDTNGGAASSSSSSSPMEGTFVPTEKGDETETAEDKIQIPSGRSSVTDAPDRNRTDPPDLHSHLQLHLRNGALIQEVESLAERGRAYYKYKYYADALNVLNEATELIDSIEGDTNTNTDMNMNMNMEMEMDSFVAMKRAIVVYQTLKVRYTMLQMGNLVEDEGVSMSTEAKDLYKQIKNEKYKVLIRSIDYYRDELERVKGTSGYSNVDINNLENVRYALHLLHSIGKLYDKKLSLYSEALEYYNEALELETRVLNLMREAKQDTDTDANVKELKQWTVNVRLTRKKVGKLYFVTGRMNMALKSSFTTM